MNPGQQEAITSPSHSPLSCGPIRLCIYPPYTFDWSRTRAHISSQEVSCSIRSKYRRLHGAQSVGDYGNNITKYE